MVKFYIEYVKCFICKTDILCTWFNNEIKEEFEEIKKGVIGWKCVCDSFHDVCNDCDWIQCIKCNKFICNEKYFFKHNCYHIKFYPYKCICYKNWIKIEPKYE